jgi:hypothetical protein
VAEAGIEERLAIFSRGVHVKRALPRRLALITGIDVAHDPFDSEAAHPALVTAGAPSLPIAAQGTGPERYTDWPFSDLEHRLLPASFASDPFRHASARLTISPFSGGRTRERSDRAVRSLERRV